MIEVLTKLAFKNVGKSFKDYAIYFFTLVFAVCIFYMFNSIYSQKDMMVVTQTTNNSMEALSQILSYISVFVAIILGFLIVYANNFFIKRRKKELGIYMTLGMNKSKISAILILETSLIAIIALVVGLVMGVFVSQFMSVFTAKIFEANMSKFKFIFAPDAAIKSILYFGLIFLIVILFNTFAISKFKLIDLLYGGRKNEKLKIKGLGLSVAVFILSVICLSAAYYLILTNGMVNINLIFLTSIILGIIGTLLFFLSLAGFLIKVIQKNKKMYFKNLNMFVMRQLNSKINTNFVSVSVVCIVLLLTIGIFSCGYSMQNLLSNDLKSSVKYDFTVYNYSNDDKTVLPIYENLPDDIKNFDGIKSYAEYYNYTMQIPSLHFKDFNLKVSDKISSINNNSLVFIPLTDYNKNLSLQGLEPITLSRDEYLVAANTDILNNIAKQFIDNNSKININNTVLKPYKQLQNTYLNNSMSDIFFIVNDSYVKDMRALQSTLNIQCVNDDASTKLNDKLHEYEAKTEYNDSVYAYSISKIDMYAMSVASKAIISFLAIYLGIVFMITCAAILAIQQLSEASDNKERYELLRKLGADKKMLNRALFTQIACYFILPLLLAIVHSAVGLTAANEVIKEFGNVDIFGSIVATSLFVLVIYGAYFGLTYVGSKSIINKG